MSEWKKNSLWLIALGILGFLTFLRGIDISYYADDFVFFSDLSCADGFDHFLGKGRFRGFYRPIEAALLTCIQEYYGVNTIPIHIINISLHALLSFLVFTVLLKLDFSRAQAAFGALFMLLSQANASAILGNDTLSQVSATFFGCFSLLFLHVALDHDATAGAGNKATFRSGFYLSSVLAFALALFSKESGVSFFPLLVGVLFLSFYSSPSGLKKRVLHRAALAFIPFVVVLVGYFFTRAQIGASQATLGHGNYNFNIGFNVAENLAELLIVSIIPLSSVTVFTSVQNGQLGSVAMIALASSVFLGLVSYGLWQTRRYVVVAVLGIFAIGALFPMVILNHVSELYAYNAMPFIAMIVGAGLGAVFEKAHTRRVKRLVLITVCALFASHIIAVQGKAALMRDNGERATLLLKRIEPYAQRVSPGGQLLLVNPDDDYPEYSIFLMRGFNVFRDGVSRIKRNANRADIAVKIIEQKDLQRTLSERQGAVVLHLYGDAVRVMGEGAKDGGPS